MKGIGADQAAAYAFYAEARGAGETATLAKEVQIWAEWKAGRFLREMEKAKGELFRGSELKPRDEKPTQTLSNLGISKAASHRWQQYAKVSANALSLGLSLRPIPACESVNCP